MKYLYYVNLILLIYSLNAVAKDNDNYEMVYYPKGNLVNYSRAYLCSENSDGTVTVSSTCSPGLIWNLINGGIPKYTLKPEEIFKIDQDSLAQKNTLAILKNEVVNVKFKLQDGRTMVQMKNTEQHPRKYYDENLPYWLEDPKSLKLEVTESNGVKVGDVFCLQGTDKYGHVNRPIKVTNMFKDSDLVLIATVDKFKGTYGNNLLGTTGSFNDAYILYEEKMSNLKKCKDQDIKEVIESISTLKTVESPTNGSDISVNDQSKSETKTVEQNQNDEKTKSGNAISK